MNINKNIFLILIIAVILVPLSFVHAGDFLKDVINGILLGIPTLIADAAKYIALYVLGLSMSLLTWVTSSDFISMGAADIVNGSPTYNFIVATGWGIVRNLANAALVIGLVYIAINIILGNEEGKIKKTLINFIIIALLINFTPVICGFIIDGSNIIMNSFLTGGTGSGFVDALNNAFIKAENVSAITGTDIALTKLIAKLGVCVFAFIASIIYILYAAIFVLRHIFLWILVIVSPIAFATKVFPKSEYITKVFPSVTYWNEWLSQFIQWCVIGIPAGFFMYLANNLMIGIASHGGIISNPSTPGPVEACIQGLLPYLVPLGFLIVGFFMTISAGQQAASGSVGGGALGSALGGAIGGAAGAMTAVTGKAWEKTAGWAGDRAGAAGTWAKEGVTGRIGGAISNLAGNEKIDTGTKEGREAGRYKFREYVGKPREIATKYHLASPTMIGKKSKDEIAADEFAKNVDFDDYEKYRERYSQPQRTAIEKKLATDDSSKFLRGAGDNPAEYQRRLHSISQTGSDKTKLAAYLKTVNNPKAGSADWAKTYKIDVSKAVSGMSAKDAVEKLTPEALGSVDIFEDLTQKQLASILERGSKQQVGAVRNLFKGAGRTSLANRKDQLENLSNVPLQTPDQLRESQEKFKEFDKKIVEITNLLS